MLAFSALAQEPLLRFEKVSPEESFATRSITDIAQDEQGFIWFTSLTGGLARFDGYEFKTYQHRPGDLDGLPSNEAHMLYPDPLGGIWVSTDRGVAWLNPDTDRLTVYQHDPGDPATLSHDFSLAMLRDRSGTLWIGTQEGLSRLDPGAERFRRYPLLSDLEDSEASLPATMVWEIYEDRRGVLWIGTTGGGLLRYQRGSDRFDRFVADKDDPAKLPHPTVRTVFEDSQERLWVGTDAGLAIMRNRDAGVFERINLTDGQRHNPLLQGVWDIAEDTTGHIWLSVGENLIVLDPVSFKFERVAHDPSDATSLGSGRIWKTFVDRIGTVWIGSDVISRLVAGSRAVTLYRSPEPVINTEPTVLLDSQGVYWLAAGREGFYSFDPVKYDWHRYLPFPDSEGLASNNWVRGVGFYESPDGRFWVTTNERLNLMNRETGEFISRDLPEGPNAMTLASDGLIWAAIPFNSLVSYDFEADRMTRYDHDPDDETTVSHPFGYVVYEDRKRRLWYGSVGGLDLVDRTTGTARRYASLPADPATLSNPHVRAVLEDHEGRIWVATDYGLNRFFPDQHRFQRFYNTDTPGPNAFSSITQGPDHALWLGTAVGVARFDPATSTFRNWRPRDGIPLGLANLRMSQKGYLYGTVPAGIVTIDPILLESETRPLPVVLTGFNINNLPVAIADDDKQSPLDQPIQQTTALTLAHDQDMVSFKFAALDYRNPESHRYAYRLTGLQTEWIETDADTRLATFTELPAGDYLLEVKAGDASGYWDGVGLALPIKVIPPPWRSWWAYMLYALLAFSLLVGFVRWRTNLLRIRARTLQAAVEERTLELAESEKTVQRQADELVELLALKEQLFTNISHEFRTPLTLMLGPIENARQATSNGVIQNQLDMAKRNGKRVLRLVDQLLEIARLTSDEPLERNPEPVGPVVELVTEAFRPLARERGIGLSFTVDENLWTEVPAATLERLVMNLVSNAFKFTGPGGSVSLQLSEDQDQVRLRVSDTGAGIAPDRQAEVFERFRRGDDAAERTPGSGIGLALVKEIVDAYRGRIELSSVEGQGTSIAVLLPRYRPASGVRTRAELPISEALKLEVETLEPPASESVAEDAENGKPHLLVIEDNADMRTYLNGLLSAFYRVEGAATGDAGLAAAKEEIPDLVICDVNLPGMNGYELANRLREDERTSHIPLILLTARSDEDSLLRGLRQQIDDYIVKPFNDEELLLRIGNILAIREILRARFASALYGLAKPTSDLEERERRFMERVEAALERRYSDSDFNINTMASEVAMSERQLQRKLKALTNQTPAQYLRLYRLKKSLHLLADGKSVGDVAFVVGFKSPAHFASCFRAQFGCTPTQYKEEPDRIAL